MQPQNSIAQSSPDRHQLEEKAKRVINRFTPSGLQLEMVMKLNELLHAAANDQAYNAVLVDFITRPLNYIR